MFKYNLYIYIDNGLRRETCFDLSQTCSGLRETCSDLSGLTYCLFDLIAERRALRRALI